MSWGSSRHCFNQIHATVSTAHGLCQRSVHAWGYRRYVIASLPDSFPSKKTPQDELRFTKKKIESNFSNFSAWHYRTKLLEGLWKDMSAEAIRTEKAQGELSQ